MGKFPSALVGMHVFSKGPCCNQLSRRLVLFYFWCGLKCVSVCVFGQLLFPHERNGITCSWQHQECIAFQSKCVCVFWIEDEQAGKCSSFSFVRAPLAEKSEDLIQGGSYLSLRRREINPTSRVTTPSYPCRSWFQSCCLEIFAVNHICSTRTIDCGYGILLQMTWYCVFVLWLT